MHALMENSAKHQDTALLDQAKEHTQHSQHVLQWHLPARPKKGLVQYVGSVSACENHHTSGGLEAIHLN